jgi:murein tripeptide amidase MpaA
LCKAYRDGTGLGYGGKSFSNAQICTIIEELNLIILPCANPDGRDHSLIGALEGDHEKTLWRGNRNYSGACNGVNLNRNQDFLWDHEAAFQAGASVLTSSDPCSDPGQNYRGSAPTSEAETKNIVWLMDRYETIYCYLDIHCHFGAIVHPWGDDTIQTTTPEMNFRNPAFNGQRNPNNTTYSEFMPSGDLENFRRLGQAFQGSLNAVRGKDYDLLPSVALAPSSDLYGGTTFHAISGANDDYAYSRHFVNLSQAKIYAFTVEYGEQTPVWASDATEVGAFQPPFPEMGRIIEDLIAGSLALCLEAQSTLEGAKSQVQRVVVAALMVLILIILGYCSSR